MIANHRLTTAAFDEIASGRAGAGTVESLLGAHMSRYLLLARKAVGNPPGDASTGEAVRVISSAQAHDGPAARRALNDAWFPAWVDARLSDHRDPAGRLANIAAAVAWQTGVAAELRTTTDGGRVHLPTLGTAVVGGRSEPAEITVRHDELEVRYGTTRVRMPERPSADGPGWLGMRRLSADGFVLALDDLGPARSCFGDGVDDRLGPEDHARWRDAFGAAWELLGRYHGEQAATIPHCLHTVVPMRPRADGSDVSVTSKHAFGVIALSLPSNAATFATSLIHEQAHSVLNGMLWIVGLVDPQAADRRYFAPWRMDHPRPTEGLLHGIYAFLAVAETWCALLDNPRWEPIAIERAATLQAQLDLAMAQLAGSGALLEPGHRLLAAMRRRLDRIVALPLPAAARRRAAAALTTHYQAWRQRHGRQT